MILSSVAEKPLLSALFSLNGWYEGCRNNKNHAQTPESSNLQPRYSTHPSKIIQLLQAVHLQALTFGANPQTFQLQVTSTWAILGHSHNANSQLWPGFKGESFPSIFKFHLQAEIWQGVRVGLGIFMRIKQQTWKATRCGWFNRSLHYTALFSGSSDHGIWALAGLLRRHGARTTLERSNTASSSKKDLDLTVNFYMPTKWKSHFFKLSSWNIKTSRSWGICCGTLQALDLGCTAESHGVGMVSDIVTI